MVYNYFPDFMLTIYFYRSQNDGFEQGKSVGRNQGKTEGNRLGWEKGAAIGSEIGFYGGYARSLLEEMQDAKPRVVKTLERIIKAAEDFPLSDPLHPELQSKLEELRTKFKQVCSQLGIKQEAPSSSENKGISF
ncbi:protein LTO1 homolog [Ruditapes philippinarum]|uniref:protein LTO1 homolog n=1 Tax=Ruditapes philippinarum TaxID=129788 RepID=UPI00295ABD52|nr:protein LTO1 homolog [Ruditapes philippinarum]